jgi:hypothetical protein
MKNSTKLTDMTLVVAKHNEDGEVIDHGVVRYEVNKLESEYIVDRVWITVTDLDGCYEDTVRQAFKDEYFDAIIEELNLPK